jgi:hypothetical protein
METSGVFETRSLNSEILDTHEFDETLARQSYAFMEVVNRYFGGLGPVKHFISRHAKALGRELHILDLGSGTCGIPIAICRWARRHGINVRFTCVEHNRHAIDLARQKLSQSGPNITLIDADVFSFEPAGPVDLAIGTLFFHHLTDEQILELLGRLRTFGIRSVLINDLRRTACCFLETLGISLFVARRVRADALSSIKRSFRPDELGELLTKLEPQHRAVKSRACCRVIAEIDFKKESPQ